MLQIWRNVGNVTETTGLVRSGGEDRTVTGCFGPSPRGAGAGTDEGEYRRTLLWWRSRWRWGAGPCWRPR